MNFAGTLLLILMGIFLSSWDPDFPIVGTPTLALPLIIAGLLWGGLALNDPLRERPYHRCSRNGSLRAAPASDAGYRRHRGSRHVSTRRFAAEDSLRRPYYGAGGERVSAAMNALATFALGCVVKNSLRIASKEVQANLYGARGSMWAVLCAIVLALTSSDLLLTGERISLSDRSKILYIVASLVVGLGLLLAGVLAADSVVGEKKRSTLEETLLTPTKRRALLLGKVLGVMAAWLLIFMTSVPYILVVGFGTSVSWLALTYTFVLGTLCVAGFASLTAGLSVLLRSGRSVTLISLTIFVAMTAPTLLGTALRKNWFGDTYTALSPVAQARLSLKSVILDKESLLAQLPHIGALMAFAVIAGVFAALAARGVSSEEDKGHEGRGDLEPWGTHETTVPAERTDSRLAGTDPEESVRL